MSFFDDQPEGQSKVGRPPTWVWPPEEIGVYVPTRQAIVQTRDSGVVLTDAVAYSCGFMLGADVVRRRGDMVEVFRQIFDFKVGRASVEQIVTLAVEFGDGCRATNVDRLHGAAEAPDPQDDELRVFEHGGGGNSHRFRMEWWVTPIPPAGPVVVEIEWPAAGAGVVRAVLDGAVIRAASKHSQPLWPDLSP